MYRSRAGVLITSLMLLLLLPSCQGSETTNTTPDSPYIGTEQSQRTRAMLSCVILSNGGVWMQMECDIRPR